MNFGNFNHQNVKMPDWIWSSRPDLAPLSRNRVNNNFFALQITRYKRLGIANLNIETEARGSFSPNQ